MIRPASHRVPGENRFMLIDAFWRQRFHLEARHAMACCQRPGHGRDLGSLDPPDDTIDGRPVPLPHRRRLLSRTTAVFSKRRSTSIHRATTSMCLDTPGSDSWRAAMERDPVHLRTPDNVRSWQSYRAHFTAGADWETIHLPFRDFTPHRLDVPLDTTRLRRIGLVAIGRAFHADLAVCEIGFDRQTQFASQSGTSSSAAAEPNAGALRRRSQAQISSPELFRRAHGEAIGSVSGLAWYSPQTSSLSSR